MSAHDHDDVHGARRQRRESRCTSEVPKQLLTRAAITDATGEHDHTQLHEIELIFGAFDAIELLALHECWNLQRLALINCGLTRISGLKSVSATLLHLDLSDQQLTCIEGLDALVRLRSLCLQQNQIEHIDGLSSCCKLQKLWLFGNRLQSIENLTTCSDLRELWLQDNAIETLDSDGSGVSTLVNLKSLHVAKNRISRIDELQHLRRLIHLRDLSFTDEHFGSNPLALRLDYRSVVVATLLPLDTLDGVPIDRTERTNVADALLAQALAFNDTLANLTLAYETELRSVSSRRDRGLSQAQLLQHELVDALNELEECIRDGQTQIHNEKQRQQHVRDANTKELEMNVTHLQHRFRRQLQRAAARELCALRRDECELEALEQVAVAEHRLAHCLATLQCNDVALQVAVQHVAPHAPDFQMIAHQFAEVHTRQDKSNFHGKSDGHIEVLQVYRVFDSTSAMRFDAATSAAAAATSTMHRQHNSTGDSSNAERYLYVVASERELPTWLQHELIASSNANNDDDECLDNWLFLFSDPLQAISFYRGALGTTLEADDSDDTSSDITTTRMAPRIASFQLLLCRVHMTETIELCSAHPRALTTLTALLRAVATPKGSVLHPPPNAFLQLALDAVTGATARSSQEYGRGHVFVARRAHVCDVVLPQFIVLCAKHLPLDDDSSVTDMEAEYEKDTDDTAMPSATSVLDAFQHALDEEVAAFHARLDAELDPAHVRLQSQLRNQAKQLDAHLEQQRVQIEHEQRLQEQLVRAMRVDAPRTATSARRSGRG